MSRSTDGSELWGFSFFVSNPFCYLVVLLCFELLFQDRFAGLGLGVPTFLTKPPVPWLFSTDVLAWHHRNPLLTRRAVPSCIWVVALRLGLFHFLCGLSGARDPGRIGRAVWVPGWYAVKEIFVVSGCEV